VWERRGEWSPQLLAATLELLKIDEDNIGPVGALPPKPATGPPSTGAPAQR